MKFKNIALENDLIVGPQAGVSSMSDWELQQRIEDRIAFSPFLDSTTINVAVTDGVATLRGTVANLLARRTVVDFAHKAGARTVHDQLAVGTGSP